MILRAIKIRLYPNKTQEQTLNKVLGCYRFVYNQMLALKQEAYNRDKSNLGLCELSKFFHGTNDVTNFQNSFHNFNLLLFFISNAKILNIFELTKFLNIN